MSTHILTNDKMMEIVREVIGAQRNGVFLKKFEKLAQIINSNNQNSKIFIASVKSLIKSKINDKDQFILLDLLEYLTCKCGMSLHKEMNEKGFLKYINSFFNQKKLTLLVKDKTLQLIVFWKYYFSTKEDILKNFAWYHKNIV